MQSQPSVWLWEHLVKASKSSYRICVSFPSCFCSALRASLYITTFLNYNRGHLSVPLGDTWHCVFDSWLFSPVSVLWCSEVPQSCVTVVVKYQEQRWCPSHWHGHYPEQQVLCLPQGHMHCSPQHIGNKRSRKYRRLTFWLAHCFWKNRKHHVMQ